MTTNSQDLKQQYGDHAIYDFKINEKFDEKRMIKPKSTVDENRNEFIKIGNTGYSNSLKMRNEFIMNSSIYEELTEILQPEVLYLIQSRSQGSSEHEDYVSSLSKDCKFELNALMNRAFIAATLYDLDWF